MQEKGQNTKQSCYRFILCPLLYGAFPSLFGNLKRLRIGSVIFFTVGSFRFNSIRSLFVYLFNGAALYVAPRTFLSVNSISVSLHYNSFRSFANSKTLAIIVSKKTRLSSSDNAVMSGVPTVTTSSSVFSTFITSSHLIFWEAEKYPSLFRLENGKKQGAKRKILQIFLRVGFISVSTLEIIHCFSLWAWVGESILSVAKPTLSDTASIQIAKNRRYTDTYGIH